VAIRAIKPVGHADNNPRASLFGALFRAIVFLLAVIVVHLSNAGWMRRVSAPVSTVSHCNSYNNSLGGHYEQF
jgi:hypothetical protein